MVLDRARLFEPPAYPWTVTYLTAVLDRQNGFFDQAIEGFRALAETNFNEARARGFDFGKDYRLLNELAGTLLERSKLERSGDENRRREFLEQAERTFLAVLEIDPENEEAHWGLTQVYGLLGRPEDADIHRQLHARYKVDDNARDRAVAAARRANPAADHAAESVVIYDLQRSGAYGLTERHSGSAVRRESIGRVTP
jgi:tetratricopeptide (TPR) repeat protein